MSVLALRRTAWIAAFLAIGLGPIVYLARSGRQVTAEPATADVCEAAASGFEPYPGTIQGEGFWVPFTPVAPLILGLQGDIVSAGEYSFVTGWDAVTVQAEPLWGTEDGFGWLKDLNAASYPLALSPATRGAIEESLAAGHEVYVAIDWLWEGGRLGVAYAFDGTSRELLAPDARGGERAVDRFILQRIGDDASGSEYLGFIIDWSLEQWSGARSSQGPIEADWNSFLAATYGIGGSEASVSRAEAWERTLPECRTYFDAPASVTKDFLLVPIVIGVPKEGYPRDAVVCIRADSGDMGCAAFDAWEDAGYVELEAYDTGEPILIQLADADGSFTERITLAVVQPDDLIEGVSIDLVEELTAPSFEAVAQANA